MVSIDELVDLVATISEKRLTKRYDLTKPQGVRGRNSDNSRLQQTLAWNPSIPLEVGLEITYRWIRDELRLSNRLPVQYSSQAAD